MVPPHESIRAYVDEMLGVERSLHETLRRHAEDAAVQHRTLASDLIERVETASDLNVAALEACRRHLGRSGTDELSKRSARAAARTAPEPLWRVRPDGGASRIVRDDYTALCFAVICYEMLHATALVLREARVAEVALNNLRSYAPLIMEIGGTMPELVVEELAGDDKTPEEAGAATAAVRNIREAWASGTSPAAR